MKVAIFSKNIDQGAFLHVSANLCHCFSLIGFDSIDMIYLEGNPSAVQIFYPSNVNFFHFKSKRIAFSFHFLFKYLLKEKPDFLISMPSYVNLAAILTTIFSRFFWHGKLIITEHATMSKKILEHKNEFILGNIDKFARIFYKFADAIVGVSSDCIIDLKKKIGLKSPYIYKVPNAVNVQMVKKRSSEEKYSVSHPWLTSLKSAPCFITVGRLAEQKNHSMLLKAFKLVISEFDARLLIVGSGTLLDSLKSLSKKLNIDHFVDFVGYKKNPYPLIKKADCFVLPSIEEAFGLVIVESMAIGTPVIAFNSAGGGPKDILDNGKYGLLVNELNENALAIAMIKLLNDPDKLLFFHKQGLSRADFYIPENISKIWKNVLLKLSFPS